MKAMCRSEDMGEGKTKLICHHCGCENPTALAFDRPLAGGRAFAQACISCRRVLGIRPHSLGDPPETPEALDAVEVERLRFLRWRLEAECVAQIGDADSPRPAA
jgi:hypothetical protein